MQQNPAGGAAGRVLPPQAVGSSQPSVLGLRAFLDPRERIAWDQRSTVAVNWRRESRTPHPCVQGWEERMEVRKKGNRPHGCCSAGEPFARPWRQQTAARLAGLGLQERQPLIEGVVSLGCWRELIIAALGDGHGGIDGIVLDLVACRALVLGHGEHYGGAVG